MDIYWQHFAGKNCSPKFDSPEPLLAFSDPYFEDYCIRCKDPLLGLKTVGVRYCEPDYHIMNKFQNRHALHWILQGEGWFNGKPFRAGDAIYAKEKIPYSLSSNPASPCVYAWITFEGPHFSQLLARLGIVNKSYIYRTAGTREIYEILYDVLYTPHRDCEIHFYLESVLYRLLSLSAPPAVQEPEDGGFDRDTRIDTAIRYLSEHFQNPRLRVGMVSDAVGISEKYFRALFREHMGVSVRDYVIKLRTDAATDLLRASNYSIGEISEMVGYPDYRQFSEIFKKKKGVSPKHFRDALAKR